jgi:hypothetical protein
VAFGEFTLPALVAVAFAELVVAMPVVTARLPARLRFRVNERRLRLIVPISVVKLAFLAIETCVLISEVAIAASARWVVVRA